MKNNKSAQIKLVVPFCDLDPLHVVWHGNYFKYFDMARFELFKQNGIDLYNYYLEKNYVFPVTKTSTKYIFPLKYNDEFICKATLVDARVKIVINFEIRFTKDNKIATKARGDQVSVKMPEMEMMLSIPDDIKRAFGFI